MAANFDTTNYGSMCGAVPPPVVSGQALAVIADPNLFQRYMRSTFPVARCVDHLYSVHVWASRAIETEYNTPEHYAEERKRYVAMRAEKKPRKAPPPSSSQPRPRLDDSRSRAGRWCLSGML